MSNRLFDNQVSPVRVGADGAVGMTETRWYVAIVNSRHEKSVAEKLDLIGIEAYVATQRELRVWQNGRRRMVDRVVIPSIVFICCTEQQRREIVALPYIYRFMVDRTADCGTLNKPVAVIPEEQMRRLQFMLGQTDTPVNFDPTAFRVHDTVRVVRGSLKGLVGEIARHPDGSHTLTVSLSILGGATVQIAPHDVEKLPR